MLSFSTNVWTDPDTIANYKRSPNVTFTIPWLFLSTLQRNVISITLLCITLQTSGKQPLSVFVILPSVREQVKVAIFTDDESTSAVRRTIFFLALICPNTNASLCRILIKSI